MAAPLVSRPAAAPAHDDLDDLFDYNVNTDDVFRDVDTNMNVPARTGSVAPRPAHTDSGAGLGIDEEIKVVKARKPVPKLDEDRLLSQAGIPKLRRTAKERLRFKGKGHEYSDAARLLQFYQLWLDELYPRAKFADGLAMIEKLGHKKRLQTMRREWIKEGKPHSRQDQEPDAGPRPSAVIPTSENIDTGATAPPATAERPKTPLPAPNGDDDLYSATPQAVLDKRRRERQSALEESLFISDDDADAGNPPSEDELDALLAEDTLKDLGPAATNALQTRPDAKRNAADNFDDEMEAMAGMDDMW